MNRLTRTKLISWLLAVAVIIFLWPNINIAQTNPTAPVILDGYRLFEVSQTSEYEAGVRAARVSQILQRQINNLSTPVEVTIDQSNAIPVIRINDNYLLSVTDRDTPPERTLLEQAQIWQSRLEAAFEQAEYERSLTYTSIAVLLSLIATAAAIAFSWLLGWLYQRKLKPWLCSRSILELNDTENQEKNSSQLPLNLRIGIQLLINLVRLFIWLYTLVYIISLFPQTRQWSRLIVNSIFEIITTTFTAEFISISDSSYNLLDLIILITLFIGLIVVSRTLRATLRSRILNHTGLNRATQETIAVVTNYLFLFISTIVILQLWGLDLSSLTVFAGVLGVGIGLAIQGIAKEFVSGIVLMLERPIQIGDFVDVGGLVGTVERISLRSTEIRTLDQVSVILPNSRFLEAEVINWSYPHRLSRLRIPVGVAYGSNPTAVRNALISAAESHKDVLSEPRPRVFFISFGDSSLDFELLVWINDPAKQFQIKSDLYFRIEATFRHRHITIPFPQRDLHINSGKLPVEFSPELLEAFTNLSEGLNLWLRSQSKSENRNGTKSDQNRRSD